MLSGRGRPAKRFPTEGPPERRELIGSRPVPPGARAATGACGRSAGEEVQPGAPPAGGLGGFRAIVPSAVPTRRPPFSHSTVTTAVRFDKDTTRLVARSTPGRVGAR